MFKLLYYFYSNRNMFYVSRYDILPSPLTKEEEEQLIIKMMEGDLEARSLLIEHNLRLVVYVAKKYDHTLGGNMDDLISIGSIGLIKAVNTFKCDKNIKLATYATRCIENEILMFLRKSNKLKVEVSLDEPLNYDYDGNELLLGDIVGTSDDLVIQEIRKLEQKNLLYQALTQLEKKERDLLEMRYGLSGKDELTQKDVAMIMGISQSYISRLEKKVIKKLKLSLGKLV